MVKYGLEVKVVAVIPCWNEGRTIGEVVQRTRQYVDDVLVVDNRSSDGTSLAAQKAGATVFQCHLAGAGASTALGIGITLSKREADVVVTLDGDGQHNADEISRVTQCVVEGRADLVIGSRFLRPYRLPGYRKFGIDMITWLYNLGHQRKITDGQSCFRAYSARALNVLMPIDEAGFAFSVEMLVKARASGLRIMEVPIQCIYHDDRKMNSSINPIRHGLSVALAVLKWRLKLEWVPWLQGLFYAG